MPRTPVPVTQMVDECLDRLRTLSFVRQVTLGAGQKAEVDAEITLVTPTRRFVLPCEIKHGPLGNASAQALIHLGQRCPGLMLLASSVGSQVGDALEHGGVNFVDAAGNCHVKLGERYLARVAGRKADKLPRTQRGLRAPAYRALFSILVEPGLVDAPSRAIASDARVSPQTANDLRRWLIEQGMVVTARKRHHWTPKGRKNAISTWLAGYATTLAPSLLIGRFRAQESDPVVLERRLEKTLDASCPWRYGGAAASYRLVGHYRGDRTVVYTRDAPASLWKELHLVRDPNGPVLLMKAPASAAFESPDPRCVHPLLAYADLLAETHDRAREAAGLLYDRYLVQFEGT